MIDANVPENESEANETEQHESALNESALNESALNESEQFSPEAEARLRSELAPEESMFKDWLPNPTPIDGPAPAP